jgi:phosphoenolpyruvate-protein phosphotransferase (PTS system enzyme I)
MTVMAAHAHGIWTGVCGEMAGEVALTPLLIGLGIDELSASPGLVPRVKKAVQSLEAKQCRQLVEDVRNVSSGNEILAKCEAMARTRYPELLSLSAGPE